MAGLNKVCLLGNVGKDPEIKSTSGGDRLASFSIATSESWRDKNSGERKEKTEWHNITVWGDGLVGIIEKYVSKGDKLYLEGKLETRKWKDQQGNDRFSTGITLRGFGAIIQLLTDKRGSGGNGNRSGGGDSGFDADEYRPGGGGSGRGSSRDDLDDEIPF